MFSSPLTFALPDSAGRMRLALLAGFTLSCAPDRTPGSDSGAGIDSVGPAEGGEATPDDEGEVGESGPDLDDDADEASTPDDSESESESEVGNEGIDDVDTPRFDLQPIPEGISTEQACKKVDVIIAVDNSGSMTEEIAALRGPVFDSFPDTLLDVGNGLDDFQLAVIDACNNPANFHDWGKGGDCQFSTGRNFMISTSGNLDAEYSCVTDLSPSGHQGNADACTGRNDDEQPANTASMAVSDPAATGANAEFVRDDAVLFIVAITDEDETPQPASTVDAIVDRMVAAKGGSIEKVVFLGIGGETQCPNGIYGDAQEARTLKQIAARFEAAGRGLFWDLCTGELAEGFQKALDIVDIACDDFPEG